MKQSGPLKRKTPLKAGSGGLKRTGPPKRRTRVKPVSARTVVRNTAYKAGRDEFMAANPWCSYPGCTQSSTDCHHREARATAPDRIVDRSNYVALCARHHRLITDNPKHGRELGLIVPSSYEIRLRETLGYEKETT